MNERHIHEGERPPIALSDDDVIARVRMALDEATTRTPFSNDDDLRDHLDVAPHVGQGHRAAGAALDPSVSRWGSEPVVASSAARRGRSASGNRRTTLMGVAATCAALVGGATWAVAQRSPSPTDLAAPEVTTAEEPPMTTLLGVDEPWFTIASPDLVPGVPSRPERIRTENEPLFQSWRVVGDGLDGFLFATIRTDATGDEPEQPAVAEGGVVDELSNVPEGRAWLVFPPPSPSDADAFTAPSLWWSRADGDRWVFAEQGLYSAASSNSWIDLVLSAEQGSGVPIVLPDSYATVFSVGITSTVVITQQYTSTTASTAGTDSAAGTVDLTVTDGAAAPSALDQAVTVDPITIAGREGWKATFGDGHVEVVWNVGAGWWGLLGISTELADRADGIIAAVAPADRVPATPVAPPP